jgi:hypothetical protein
MLRSSDRQQQAESPIYGDLSLYKVIDTKSGRPLIIHNNGGVSAIIPFAGINNTSLDEAAFEAIFGGVTGVLSDIAPGIVTIQFLSLRSSGVESVDSTRLPSFLKPRADHFRHLAETNQVFKNDFFLSVFVAHPKPPTKELVKDFVLNLIAKKNPLIVQYGKAYKSVDERASLCVETMNRLITMLREIGIPFTMLKAKEEYYSILQGFTRPNKSAGGPLAIDDSQESPRQVLFSGTRAKVTKLDFTLDDYWHKVYTLDRSPKKLVYGRTLDAIHGIPFEYSYSVAFRTMTHKESIDLFKFRLAERRISSGTNETAWVEDRSLIADERRVSDSYDLFADGESVGTMASANVVVRVKESHIEAEMRARGLSRAEVLRRIDYSLSRDVFPRFGGSEWVSEENTAWPVFCQTIPGMANMAVDDLKSLFLTTENLPYFFPLWDSRRPIPHDGVNHFVDERGNFITFDLMDPSLPAWNYYVSGETGSGKSVLVNTILTMQYAEAAGKKAPVVCILDVGGERGSYMKLMSLVRGSVINLSGIKKPHIQMFEINPELSSPTPNKIASLASALLPTAAGADLGKLKVSLRNFFANALDKGRNNLSEREISELFFECVGAPIPPGMREQLNLKPGECEPTGKAMNLIMGILEVILSSSAKDLDGYRNFDYDQVQELVLALYRSTPGRFPYMTDFYELAVNGNEAAGVQAVDDHELRGRKFLSKIRTWTREGANAMFDMPTDVDLANDTILVDLKGLQSEPNLQLIYTLLFSELFSNKMYFTRGRRKLMIRDEAWSIMNNDKARKYLVEDLRTARKNGFATITISQLPTDVLHPDRQDGKAILGNMQVHVMGLFRSDSIINDIASEISLTEEMSEELKHLGQKKELQADGSQKTVYSRFMMKIGPEVYLLRNILHPFESILYSSSEDDNAIIDYFMKETRQYDKLEDVLWLIAKRGHVGNHGLLKYLEDAGYKNAARSVRGDGI